FKAGDRVGVGAQVQSCMKCPQCKSNNENYCPDMVGTYPSRLETQVGGRADRRQIPTGHHT
ncbi:unnamed protein product, partial [Diplocarpon coronariae]